MYAMKGGIMEEIKGNKFPIGGGIYKNQTKLHQHEDQRSGRRFDLLQFRRFPDQFWRARRQETGTKESKRIVEIAHKKPMKEAAALFDQEWENWRGEHKQTDDVLLIRN